MFLLRIFNFSNFKNIYILHGHVFVMFRPLNYNLHLNLLRIQLRLVTFYKLNQWIEQIRLAENTIVNF